MKDEYRFYFGLLPISFTWAVLIPLPPPLFRALPLSSVATHVAAVSMQERRCSGAVCAGVNYNGDFLTTATFLVAGMLSGDGRCKTLDAAADGYLRGEAVISLLLKPRREGGAARVIILGSAVNQDGRSSSLTAPNGPAQQAVMRAALRAAALSGGEVGALQMHGTGTPLGDPIEAGAAHAALLSVPGAPLAIGAAKSAVGHSEAPSGLVGLLQLSMMLVEGASAPILHLRTLSPHVVPRSELLRHRGAAVPRQPAALPAASRSAAAAAGAVSAFAFQGEKTKRRKGLRGG